MPNRIVRVSIQNELDEYHFNFELENGRWYIPLETSNTDELVSMMRANPLVAVQGSITSDFRYSSRDLPVLIGFVIKYWADN